VAPAVSVAVCTHNGAAYVEEQLRSILGQSFLPSEIVVSDDASTDGTVAIVRSVLDGAVAAHPRLSAVVIQNPVALGVTRNFEQALSECSGDLIVLSDQDDVWHPDRVRAAVAGFEATPELVMIGSNARLVDDSGSPLGQSLFEGLEVSLSERADIREGRGFEALLRRNLATGATMVVRRQLVERAVPFPEPWVHDEWLAVIGAAIGSIEILDDQLIDYRQHATNQIGVSKKNLRGKIARLLEPRAGRYEYLAERATVLLERLESMGDAVPARLVELARGKAAHLSTRVRFPAARWRRVWPVLREAATGRYGKFSRGTPDLLRDLLQKP
jgi:glycosyltransferase involved in cell wall biosynthesis